MLLLDLALPDGSGLDLISVARAASAETRVLIVSALGDAASVVQAIRRGADGYFLKGGDAQQVEAAIRLVLAGGSPISPSVAGHILALVRSTPAARPPAKEAPALTPREFELLQSLAKGLSYRELAELHGIAVQTVAVHVKSIYRKLEVASRGEAVFEAAQLGLITLAD